MVYHIRDIGPLFRLLEEVGTDTIEPCPSRVPGELSGGFCQALFASGSSPEETTLGVIECLSRAGARYPRNHELFFGHRDPAMPVATWLTEATEPFRQAGGCVPVVITRLTALSPETTELFAAPKMLSEPVLVRLLLDDESVPASARLMANLLQTVRESGQAPAWWPLFQTGKSNEPWETLRLALRSDFAYVCAAINPFYWQQGTEDGMLDENVCVVQIPIGDRFENGTVSLPGTVPLPAMPASGGQYSVAELGARLQNFDRKPVLIVLGPTHPEWSPEHNIDRVHTVLEVLNGIGIRL